MFHVQLPVHLESEPNNTVIPTPGILRRRWEENCRKNNGYIQGPPKKCIHTLTKENSSLYNRLL